MASASLDSKRITTEYRNKYENISSIVVSNYGTNVLYVTIEGVRRPVPPVNTSLGAPVPIAPFKIESFGHGLNLDIKVEFDGDAGDAIIDAIQLNHC